MAKQKSDENKAGRPTKFNEKVVMDICIEIATSMKGLHKICDENKEYPHVATIYRWLMDESKIVDGQPFCDLYTHARQLQGEYMKDEILRCAYDSSQDTDFKFDQKGNRIEVENKEWTQRSRLKVDTLKFLMAKLHPQKYGDAITLKGDKENPIEAIIEVNFDD